eukprot:gene6285-6357_t
MKQRQTASFFQRAFLPLLALSALLMLAGTSATRAADALETISIMTAQGPHTFSVEVMETPEQHERGLMFRRNMPADRGMLFNFHEPQPIMMWMKNTYIPLDMIFTDQTGKITWIAENAEPLSEAIIPSHGPIYSVLEVNGGVVARLKIRSKRWLLEYDANSPRTADPLMGWTSSSDMLSQVKIWFETKDEAVVYAKSKGLAFRVEEPKVPARKGMSYTDNFRHNRSRYQPRSGELYRAAQELNAHAGWINNFKFRFCRKLIMENPVAEFKAESDPAPVKVKVAIITRTKSRIILLHRAIKSVLEQTESDWVHVIVNDGGIQGQLDSALERYKSAYGNRLVVVHNAESLGMEAASNIGIGSCDSKYIVIHDDDDSWSPVFLEKMVGWLEAVEPDFPSVKGAICHTIKITEEITNGNLITNKKAPFNTHIRAPVLDLAEILITNTFPPISFLFSRSSFADVGKYDESLPVLGDWDFNVRFCMNYDIMVVHQPLAYWHHRPAATGSLSNSLFGSSGKHAIYNIILRNRWLREDIRVSGRGLFKVADQVLMQISG